MVCPIYKTHKWSEAGSWTHSNIAEERMDEMYIFMLTPGDECAEDINLNLSSWKMENSASLLKMKNFFSF